MIDEGFSTLDDNKKEELDIIFNYIKKKFDYFIFVCHEEIIKNKVDYNILV